MNSVIKASSIPVFEICIRNVPSLMGLITICLPGTLEVNTLVFSYTQRGLSIGYD